MGTDGQEEKEQQGNKQSLVCADCGKPFRSASVTSWIFGGAPNTCRCVSLGGRGRETPGRRQSGGSLEDLLEKRSRSRRVREPDKFLSSRYKIGELIGVGGMGAVYKAEDVSIGKTFAIKILQKELAEDPLALRRFEREAAAIGQLTHNNIVAVYEYGTTEDSSPYIVMDYLEGTGLDARLQDRVYLSPAEASSIFIQVADALEHAHDKGIVHRDVKPSNIILTGPDDLKLVDFGIAKVLPEGDKTTMGTTQTGELVGSPWYMSPEQCTGKPVDGRSDIYSLGCVLYEALTGKPPFTGDNPVQIILHHVNDPPERPSLRYSSLDIPEDLEYIVLRCLEKSPDDRYQSARDLKADLEHFLAGEPIKRVVSRHRDMSRTQLISFANLKGSLAALLTVMLLCACAMVSFMFVSERLQGGSMTGGAGSATVERWTEMSRLGQESFDIGDYRSAGEYFRKSLDLAESMKNSPELVITSLSMLSDLSSARGMSSEQDLYDARIKSLSTAETSQVVSIEAKLERALAQSELDSETASELADSANDALTSLIESGNYSEARRLMTATLRLVKNSVGDNSEEMARCLHNSAALDHEQGNYESALAGYDRALALERKLFESEHVIKASTLLLRSRLRLQLGIADETVKLDLIEALKAFRHLIGPFSHKVGWCRYHLGLYYLMNGDSEMASQEIDSALTVFKNEQKPDSRHIARCLALEAEIEGSAEKFQEALKLFESESVPDYPYLTHTLIAYAELLSNLTPEKSINLLKRAEALCQHLGSADADRIRVRTRLILADAYRSVNRLEESKKAIESALELATSRFGPESHQVFSLMIRKASLYEDTKDFTQARELYRNCLQIFSRHSADPKYRALYPGLKVRADALEKRLRSI